MPTWHLLVEYLEWKMESNYSQPDEQKCQYLVLQFLILLLDHKIVDNYNNDQHYYYITTIILLVVI